MNEEVNRVNSYRIKRYDDSVIPESDLDNAHVYPVRVYDPHGNLTRTISAAELKARPMEEAIHAI